MAIVRDVRVRTRSIAVGIVDDRCTGSLAYALRVALEESATIRTVRVSDVGVPERTGLGLPVATTEVVGDPVELLVEESRHVELLVVEVPRDAVAALVDPMLVQLRRRTETLLVEVDHGGEVVRASGPEGWSYSAVPDLAFAMPPVQSADARVFCVGVDGSPASGEAVAWAAAAAVRSAARLRLVSAYGGSGTTDSRTKQQATDDVASAIALLPAPAPEGCVVKGEPAEALLDASRGASMLVLGRHGTQGMLHSASAGVGDTCARLADCPVVIVPFR